jgi:exodeoxyribonuclease III
VLRGDLNVARAERDARAIGQHPEERLLLDRILERGLADLERALDPDNDGLFTWWAPWRNHRRRNIGRRLDYVLVSEPLVRVASRCVVLADLGTSDHAPSLPRSRGPPDRAAA